MIPTPHIDVSKKGIIAKTVLMPGDPLRAKFIAETFLKNPVKFNTTRNMLGYTGEYNGKQISVMGSGMGMPSIGIYSYELFNFYDVDNIIRVGSCGGYSEKLKIHDIILSEDSWTDSSYGKAMSGFNSETIEPSNELNDKILNSAKNLNIEIKKGRVHSSDVFYRKNFEGYKIFRDNNKCDVVEMESFALFLNAKESGKNAASILTVSDLLFDFSQNTTAKERETSFTNMMKIALDSI